ncbi:hypothetical protein CEXT_146441 [Caerostris extrusa]|uniref:Uncharacterized protein n=1 Tax=Caerostris extrusa TaxID=172846 RepID=A0AAV4MI03_CAEEX|nr:hypothetical protein CEXT_146441 [Caerostris extrusa]
MVNDNCYSYSRLPAAFRSGMRHSLELRKREESFWQPARVTSRRFYIGPPSWKRQPAFCYSGTNPGGNSWHFDAQVA